jgi:hypothetical protein
MKSRQWIQLGAFMYPNSAVGAEVHSANIRQPAIRREWSDKNASNSIVAFYNTGSGLFFDPFFLRADTSYHYPWLHVPFRIFCTQTKIKVSHKLIQDLVAFQHSGHGPCGVAKILVGPYRWTKSKNRFVDTNVANREVLIPPLCIQYLAIKSGEVVDQLLVCQPLPLLFFSKSGMTLSSVTP